MKALEYIQTHGISALEDKFGIRANWDGDLVCLKYNQLDSPKTSPIVRECRGLVLKRHEGKFTVVCQPFYRFFNHGEGGDKIHIDKTVVQEKHDGSLLSLYYDGTNWQVSTSGTPTANTKVGDWDKTFAELFWEAMPRTKEWIGDNVDTDFTFTFELCSPYNKVVRRYEKPQLYLLTVRVILESGSWHEVRVGQMIDWSKELQVPRPEEHPLNDLDDIIHSFAKLRPEDEGYVCVDYSSVDENGNYARCKIKNPAYVALHHKVDSLSDSRRGLLEALLVGEVSEIVTYFPEYTEYLNEYSAKLESYKAAHQKFCDDMTDWSPQRIGREAKDQGLNTALIFAVKNKKATCIEDAVHQGYKAKGKSYAKKLLKILEGWE